MIKLFVSDLDGTLLDNDHKVTKETKEAIIEMRKQGISFMPASGRDYPMLMSVISQIGIKPKAICLNGAEFYDNEGNLIANYPIDKNAVYKIVEIIKEYNLDVDYYCHDGRYNNIEPIHLYDLLLARYMRLFTENKKEKLLKFIEDEKLLETTICEPDLDKILEKNIMKIEICFSNEKQKVLVHKALRGIENVVSSSAFEYNLEINAMEATKGMMIEKVCEIYGYKHDEVLVIGDGFNDVSMLQKFDNSFAMGQANDEVKRYATYVCESNIDHGVAKTIKRLLKNNKEIID